MQLSSSSMKWDRRRYLARDRHTRLTDIDEGSARAPETAIECGSTVSGRRDDKALLPGVHSALGLSSPDADGENIFAPDGAATTRVSRDDTCRARTWACFAFGFFCVSLLLSTAAVGRHQAHLLPGLHDEASRTAAAESSSLSPPPVPPVPPPSPLLPAVALSVLSASMSSTLSNVDFPGHDFSAGDHRPTCYVCVERSLSHAITAATPPQDSSHAFVSNTRSDPRLSSLRHTVPPHPHPQTSASTA